MLCFGVCHQLKIPKEKWYGLFVFSAALITYNSQRLIKVRSKIIHPTNHILWIMDNKPFLGLLIVLSSIICGTSFYKIYNGNIHVFLVLIPSAAISLFYVLKVKGESLRDLPYLKIHLIAFVCTISTGIFVLINEENYLLRNWCFTGIHYLYFLAVTIPFDIRDLKYDNPKQKTIPQILGIQKSKILSLLLLVIYLFLAIAIRPVLIHNTVYLAALFFTSLLIIAIDEKRHEFYYSGLIEGSIFSVGLSYLMI